MTEFDPTRDERDLVDEELASEMAQEFHDAEEVPPEPRPLTRAELNAIQMREIMEYPAVKGMVDYEAQREQDLIPIREAFVKSRQKREK